MPDGRRALFYVEPKVSLPLALLALAGLVATPALASSPDAWAQGKRDARAACRKASGLANAATIGEPLLFSDAAGKTAILVTGNWRPAHMKGRRTTMLCLYDRASRKAEAVEAVHWSVAGK
jgi:hypothetical protein